MRKILPLALLCLVLTSNTVKAEDKFVNETLSSLDAEVLVTLNEALSNHHVFSIVESPDMELLAKIIENESLKADAGETDPSELE